ncbi:MAG: ATP synthase F1 subunit delta [Lachnospiraceae bacterium]|nr:ATP synthase F1 subunit delta [Lachnospiraceae bacterium]
MAKLISKTYGEAFFELVCERNQEDQFLEEVEAVLHILDENPGFTALMNHPKVTKEEKLSLLDEAFKGKASDEMTGFLTIIVKKDRFSEIDAILAYIVSRIKENKGIGIASVTTPQALTEQQKKAVEDRLLATTGYKSMEMHYEEDESLIAGMQIRIGDRVVDSSVKTKIEELKRQLLKIQVS